MIPEVPETFGEFVRRIRDEYTATQKQFAAYIEVTVAQLMEYEAMAKWPGKNDPIVRKLRELQNDLYGVVDVEPRRKDIESNDAYIYRARL